MWIVYLLRCVDKSLYCGITNNLEKRLKQHNGKLKGGAKYTRSRNPCILVYQESLETKSDALKREIVIKNMDRNEKINLLQASKFKYKH